ncbi:MAG: hypothetical protein ACRELY_22830 [Polyangiaceae bacterium]
MRSTRDTLPLLFLAGIVSAATGCSNRSPGSTADDSAALAEEGTDANDVESQSATLTAAFTLGTGDFTHPEASVAAAANVAGFFAPQSCVTTQTDAANLAVNYTLLDCTGPWGLAKISGTLKVVYAAVTGGISLDVTGTGLQFNADAPHHGSADLHATATVTASGSAREMTWNASLTGTTARGNALSRTASWDMKWRVGESCIALDGSAEGAVADRTLKTEVDDYQRCADECPAAGGKITVDSEKDGEQVTLSFDGSNVATFTGVDGKLTKIVLACGL